MNKQDWTYKKLGEVGTFQRGKGIKRADFVETGMPCIHYGQIHTSFGVSTNRHLSSISSELFEQSIKASHGDVIIALTSEDVEGSCKATAWLGNYDIAISSDAAFFRHNLNSKYISYYLRSKSFFVEKSKYARGFKVTHIKTSEIAEIGIPVPPIGEQERIVAELDLLQGIIEKKKEQLKAYDQLAQSIFYTMFGDPIDNPKGWEVKKLGEISTIGTGATPSRDKEELYYGGDINWVKTTEVHNCDITETEELITQLAVEQTNCKIYPPNTLLMAMYGQGKTRGQIAKLRINAATNQACAAILLDFNICNLDYIYELLLINYEYIRAMAQGGNQANLNMKLVASIPIILPPLSLQEEFAEKVEAIERQKALVQQSIEEVQTMFDCTMDKYFG